MDGFAVGAMHSGRADRRYVSQGDGVYIADLDNPNFGIGFTPNVINTFHETHGLTIVPPIRFGTWSGRKVKSFVYQDVVVARKGTANTEPNATAEELGSPWLTPSWRLQRRPPSSSMGYRQFSRAGPRRFSHS